MSGFPGLPFRSVDQFNLTQTPVFPSASLSPLYPGISGYSSGFLTNTRSLYDPLLPLTPRISSPALPVGFARADLPYASSLLDPRNQLLRSPNYYLSPNASPLTFDQINSQKDKEVASLGYEARYRSSTDLASLSRLSAFAPEPHYKTYTSSDIARLGFPLELSPLYDRESKDNSRHSSFISPKQKADPNDRKDSKHDSKDKNLYVKPKLWKPFETESPAKTSNQKTDSDNKVEKTLKDQCNNNVIEFNDKSTHEDNAVTVESNSHRKKDPARPIPQYPSGIGKSLTSEKNTSFTTFQPWKSEKNIDISHEKVNLTDGFDHNNLAGLPKVNHCESFREEHNELSLENNSKDSILIEQIDEKLHNNHKSVNSEDIAGCDLKSYSEGVVNQDFKCGKNQNLEKSVTANKCGDDNCITVSCNSSSIENDFEHELVTNNAFNIKGESELGTAEVRLTAESSSDILKSNLEIENHDSDYLKVENNTVCKKENEPDVLKDIIKDSERHTSEEGVSDYKEEHTNVTEDIDDGKVRRKSIGKERRISEVCASLFSLSHVAETESSTDCSKTTDSISVDNHSAINKPSTSDTCKKKRRNSSVDKHLEFADKTPTSRPGKEVGYRTDFNFNQINFEQQMSVMSGSCVQGYNNPPVACQSGMRHPYTYSDNAVNYPPNMAGKNNQCFQDNLAHENAKTLPNHEAKQSNNDFKMTHHSQSKPSVNDIQEISHCDSFNSRAGNSNEFKVFSQDNGSKYSPVRANSSSSGSGALSYGMCNTDSNSDSNFATSVSNTETNSTDAEVIVEPEVEPPFKWDYLHSKQFVDVIYKNQGCEFSGVVKSDIESLRDSDSPKTILDLDTVTKTKPKTSASRSQGLSSSMDSSMYSSMSDNQNFHRRQVSSPYYNQNTKGNSYDSQWGPQRANQNEYASGDTGGSMKSDSFGSNQGNQNYNSEYQKYNQTSQSNGVNQYDSSKGYQSQYSNQPTSGSSYYMSNHQHSQDSYHGNSYNENSQYYDQNHQNSNQQYSSGQGYSNSYQNMNQQYGNSGYRSHNSNQNSGMPYQPNSHSPSSSQSYLPSNVESPELEPGGTPTGKKQYKKRGRKRKAEKELELSEQALHRPNTIVQLSTNVGPLIHSENSTDSIDSYDYLNNPVETIFDYSFDESLPQIANQFIQIEQELCQRLLPLKYGHPVNVIYNPLIYSFQTHRNFVQRFLTSQRPILFLGMNPGPYGMSQNGVPFGEVTVVKDWLKIKGRVFKPETEHPKKPVSGLGCTRIEVSGARFWGLFQRICKIPENFFKNCYVHNLCPQAYLSESGKNITPPQLAVHELEPINKACDAALVELVRLLNTRIIIAVGKFVQTRATKALHNAGIRNITVECILHPSPINPHANKGWEQIVAKQLIEIGVMQYLNTDREEVQRHIEDWERAAMAAANSKLPVSEFRE